MEVINDLAAHWAKLDAKKGNLIKKSEQYAMWTMPYICPKDVTEGAEQEKGYVSIGASLVNYLANRISNTMFPSDKPFFRIVLSEDAKKRLSEDIGEDQLNAFSAEIHKATSSAETAGMRALNITAYRPVAVSAIQHQIVTGNAVIHRTPSGERVVYGVKDFCVSRDLRGNLLEVILKDSKRIQELPEEIRDSLEGFDNKDPDATVDLYTYYFKSSNRWQHIQGVNNFLVQTTRKTFNKTDFPIISLVWSLSRGESYGRGLVEDHAVAFHNLDVTTRAVIDLIGFAADLKFLVSPSAQVDIEDFNRAPRGAYMLGARDDITTPDFPKRVELQILMAAIEKWERELAQAFLMSSRGVRDAERVTAEEIRFYARELESAFGGLYSRLAVDWQKQEAEYLVSEIDFETTTNSGINNFDVLVVTGLESLSRENQLEDLRLAIADLQMLEAVPEDMRAAINKLKFAQFVFSNRGVKLEEFMYTPEEMQALEQQAAQEQADAMQEQTDQDIEKEAAKQTFKESE